MRNRIVVKVAFSKPVRGNEEWQIESVIKNDNLGVRMSHLKKRASQDWISSVDEREVFDEFLTVRYMHLLNCFVIKLRRMFF